MSRRGPHRIRASWLVVTLALGTSAPAASVAAQDLAARLAEADEARRSGEPEVAESTYRDVLTQGWMRLGDLESTAGRWDAALSAYETADAGSFHSYPAKRAQARTLQRLERFDEARRLLQGLVSQEPDRLDLRREMADLLFAAGLPDEALQELEDVAGRGDPEADFALAGAYLRAERLAPAKMVFDAVAEARPIPQTLVLIGRALRDAKYFDEARPYLEKALEQDPDTLRARFYLGTLVLYSQGRDPFEEAVEHFEGELELRRRLGLDEVDTTTHLSLGLTLAEMRRFEDAVQHLEIAARDAQAAPDALHNLGRCFLELDRPEDAVQSFEKALELGSDLPAEQQTSLHYQLGRALRAAGRGDEAAPHFAAAKTSSGRFTENNRRNLTRYLEGQSAGTDGIPASSLSDPDREAALMGTRRLLTTAYLNLGIQQMRRGRPRVAARLLGQGAHLTPDFPRIQYSLGVARFNAGLFGEAVEPLLNALAADDEAPRDETRRMAALALFNAERYAAAADLLAEDPGRASEPSLQFTYAVSLVRSDRTTEAGPVFEALLRDGHDWPQLQVAMGQAEAKDGHYEGAVEALERALSIDPKVAEAHATLGEIALRQGRFDDAETHFRAELEHHPEDLGTRFQLATALDVAEAHDEAVVELEAILKRKPDHGDARYLLGKIQLAEGRPEAALPQLLAAAGLAPKEPNVFYQLGLTYRALGRQEDAAAAFDTFRSLKKASREAS